MLANGLDVVQVVVLLDQTVEQGLLGSTPHLAELERLKLRQGRTQRRAIDGNQLRLAMLGDRIGQYSPNRWKLNSPGAMQGQHQPAANHITQPAVRLYPLPGLAEFLGKAASTRPRVLGDQLTNEIDIGFTDYPMPVSKCDAHARQRSNLLFGTQALSHVSG